ncbi:MAG: ABC transporter ATP-binding protein [Verrucomicrobia bacterium]|nr:ABC transporter ATP-binding protein [Verrucomicrobiota bacterium]
MPLIEVENIHKEYEDGKTTVHALRGIDLTIDAGEFTAIAGPSGSGKTTLLNLISGLDAVSAGNITLDSVDISSASARKLSQLRLEKIGFVFQAYNLVPVLTARENVEFTMLLQGVPSGERRKRSLDMLERVGLGEYADRKPTAMSGGQQQRVAVARAIVTHPRVVLADEPTANLDSETGSRLLDLMKRLNAEEDMTFVFSTHDPMVMDYSTRLVRLHDGKVKSDERK